MALPTPTLHARIEDQQISIPGREETVLIYATDPARSAEMAAIVEGVGWLALTPRTADAVVQILDTAPPDVFLLAVTAPSGEELTMLDHARAGTDRERVPVICLLDKRHRPLVLDAFGRRADDVIWGNPSSAELIARLRTRIERPPVPRSRLVEDPVTGALTSEAFGEQLRKERERVERGGRPGALAFIAFDELPELAARHGSRARDELLAQVVRLTKADGRKLDFVGWRRGMVAILLPSTPTKGAQIRFDRLVHKLYEHEFVMDGSTVRLTPVIGFTETVDDATEVEYEDRTWDATAYQSDQLDLHPTRWVSSMSTTPENRSTLKGWFDRIRTPFQILSQQAVALVVPFVLYMVLDELGFDITGWLYLAFVVALAVTAVSILVECRAAVRPTEPPPAPDQPPPLASAIIAAYLPNEAGTVIETIEAFLEQDYPKLEIILAYNTPRRLEVEDELAAIAARDPRFVPLRVEGSVSKAQNVNAAMAHVQGEFVGLFDADHHPAPGSFHRAWSWLAGGAGVVQGHCVIRNGATNSVTRLVATEFEAIYAVAHPGRARIHGFGVFGGSNGYWRTTLLQRTRMRGAMLTEDIDSSMRVVQSGEVIISDPDLVSTELAPETWGALWNQRLRWAQGWSQVSLRHLVKMGRSATTLRQRIGAFYLLGWREIYPWISLQIFPLLTYWWYRDDPPIDWFIPIFVATSLLTFSVGPLQTWASYQLAHPSIKQHRSWFVLQGFSAFLFYTELKNVMARTAHLKEAMRERKWKVTPRTGSVALDAEADHASDRSNADTTDPVDDNPTNATQHSSRDPSTDTTDPGADTTNPVDDNPTNASDKPDRPTTTTRDTNPAGAVAAASDAVVSRTAVSAEPSIGHRLVSKQTFERVRRHGLDPAATSARRKNREVRGEPANPKRPNIYDHQRDDWQNAIYDAELETDGWPIHESKAPTQPHGDRRSNHVGGRRASDSAAARVATAPVTVPIRLFEPDFQRQTIHTRSAERADPIDVDRSVNEPDEPSTADVNEDVDSTRSAEPAVRRP